MNLFEAVKYGAALAFCIGPTFFYLLGVSIKQGLLKAVNFALGIAVSDIIIILLVLLGLGAFFQTEAFHHWFNLISAILMVFVGIFYIKNSKKTGEVGGELRVKEDSHFGYFIKGVVINGFNPFTAMMWVFIGAQVHPSVDVTFQEIGTFTFALAATVFFFDCIKAYLAHSIKKFLTPQNLQKLDFVLGLIFLGISGFFFLEFGKIYF